MKQYRPPSWSAQARKLADRIVDNHIDDGTCPPWTLEQCINFFRTSYRNDLIRQRAVKRFGRIARKRGWQ